MDKISIFVGSDSFLKNYYKSHKYQHKIKIYMKQLKTYFIDNKKYLDPYINFDEIYKKIPNDKKTINDINITKNEIISAPNINNNLYDVLLNKQELNKITRSEQLMMEKYLLKKDWKIKIITPEFMEKYYGKTHILYNLRWLIDQSKIDPDEGEKLEQIKIIKDIITKASANNKIFVIWKGDKEQTYIEDGIRYITYNDIFEIGVTSDKTSYKN